MFNVLGYASFANTIPENFVGFILQSSETEKVKDSQAPISHMLWQDRVICPSKMAVSASNSDQPH